MTEREALEKAREELQWILDTLKGRSFPGRMQRVRDVQLPKVLEIIEEVLGNGDN